MSGTALLLAVFLACAVEAVEALTVVLAAGVTRGWRSPLLGVGAAVLALAAVVALLGPAVGRIPLGAMQLVIGALLLVFGLQWLRKAILRASGFKARHDEDRIYREQVTAAATASHESRAFVTDWYGFTLAFKGVLLEGLEVAFIVVTFGSVQGRIGLASLGAAAAVVLVVAVGLLVRAPLARVPENTMKFAVGVLLTAFGTFWGAEGAGAEWPGADAALLVLVPGILAVSLAYVALLRRTGAAARSDHAEVAS
ncbi:COG4280 domain-containing protein [Streptomyces sp. NPDC002514]|uniref:COG4280 domain-containing protein n=1 Tax=Streptomyces sp. NPDC001270 TaxID=3364554 RepID=UPI003699B83D